MNHQLEVTRGRFELPRLKGHDVLSVACLPFHHLAVSFISSPYGTRTRIAGSRIQHPEPLEERAVSSASGSDQSASMPIGARTCTASRRVGYSHVGSPVPSRRM